MAVTKKTNVIFILTDDQGPWAAGCYGNHEIRTPYIDKLADEGIKFNNFFCTSPVCSPARASIMTGRIPSQHGVHDWIRDGNMPPDASSYLEDFMCYTDILSDFGYTCGLSGKWHLGDSVTPQHGFTHWFCHQSGGGSYNDAPMVRNGKPERISGYISDVITDDALSFIDSNRDQPFYLNVNYTAPHSPWTGHPQDIVDSYDDCAFKSCPQEALHPWAGPLTKLSYGSREMLKGYFAAVTAMDLNIGRILQHLEIMGLKENTLIIFSSDNGFSCGHHGFWGKGNGTFPLNMFENSIRVPMIFSHPGNLDMGKSVEGLTSQYDIFPTLLDYLDIPVPDDSGFPGKSFTGLLEGRTGEAGENIVVYDEYGPVRMIRTTRWKYVHRYPFGIHELYDLKNDPGERVNLIEEPSRLSIIKELRGRLTDWFTRYVNPGMDGTHFPVSGSGQKSRIGRRDCGEECFYADRLSSNNTGFPSIGNWNDSKELESLIADK